VPLSRLTVSCLPAWDPQLLSSGAYKYAPYIGAADLDVGLRAGTLEFYKEGAAATVSVRRLAGVRALSIDGKVDASNGGDMLTQRLLGLLPVALHGRAREICVIGLGSGVTLGSALAPGDVRHADVVEISPEVVEASHLFDRENGSVLAHPAVRLIVGDGRSHLLLTPRKYDVIISEPSNPWMAGVATLFTREFFEAARARLAPTVCSASRRTYDISQEDLRSIVRTFASVFPRARCGWSAADLLLIGGPGDDVRSRLDGLPSGSNQSTAGMLATVNVRRRTRHSICSPLQGRAGRAQPFGERGHPDRRPHQADTDAASYPRRAGNAKSAGRRPASGRRRGTRRGHGRQLGLTRRYAAEGGGVRVGV
jgi:hypothetical protein